ncbi:hypothetical protein [Mechercharimyces sp. CAU 1602]|uniref:hypothetical protein n=1 Tax=Mechercharimyces sp. CAU 1602 TaxID=2973933 RepID=UPI00216298FE|nr:hypothetical protein [Mechercharimyces sp. CAU 1602]MCS1351628.1 hypothetical protein [Mechercharimyces sp. CAU 1602]
MMTRAKTGLILASSLMLYGVITIPTPGWSNGASLFSLLWIGLALLMVAAYWKKILMIVEVRNRKEERKRWEKWLRERGEEQRLVKRGRRRRSG